MTMDSKRKTSKLAPTLLANTISNQWRPLTRILAVLCPYRLNFSSRATYGTKTQLENPSPQAVAAKVWKYPLSAYPHCLLLCFISVCIMQAFNIGLDLPIPFRLVGLTDLKEQVEQIGGYSFGTHRIVIAYLSFLRIVENLVIFLGTPGFVAWLGRLDSLQQELNATGGYTSARSLRDVSRDRNLWFFGYFITMTGVWMASQYGTLLPKVYFNPSLWALGHFWFFVCVYVTLCQPLLEDVKIFLMLVSLEKVYKCFREVIGDEVAIRGRGITQGNIQFWLKYSTKLRRQVERTGEYLKSQIMLSLTESLVGTSVGVYLTLRFIRTGTLDDNFWFATTAMFYSIVCALRSYLKAQLAEKIYSEERKLYENVIDMEQELKEHLPTAVLVELRDLRKFLRDNPARVNLGNYVVLNNNFLIQVAIQSVTMLIAVTQFHTT